MLEKQPVLYFVSHDPQPIHDKSPLWHKDLPLCRHQHPGSNITPAGENLTYGEYFQAAAEFLQAHRSDFIPKAVFNIIKQKVDAAEISGIHIHLEKHGAFYHPSRIVVVVSECRVSLVLNVAVSAEGKRTIQGEYHQLKKLAGRFSPAWMPRVYGYGRSRNRKGRHVRMFLGEWLEGFHEFHLSEREDTKTKEIRVWDSNNRNLFLSKFQTQSVFEQTAMILTAYYDIETFEQIDAWHHAAGDFIVCMREEKPRVKLISVRRYMPLFKLSKEIDTLETILNTLLIFLLKISIRLRIDRMDGVGDMAWIDMDVVEAIIRGFFKGLVLQAETSRIPYDLIDAFKVFLLHLPETDIRDIFKRLVHQIDPKNPDLPVIKSNLYLHTEAALSAIRKMQTTM